LALLAVGAFYAWQLARSVPPDEARAAAFMSLVLANFGLVLANRSLRGSLLASLRRRNPLFWQIVLATTGLLALVMAFEPARRVFRFALPDAGSLGLAVAVAGATWGGLMVLQRLRIRAGST
jgi:Ca2+-transporting ATPase